MKILFMCVANSARSQLAEALAKNIFSSSVEIESAGSEPKNVNPIGIEVLKELGIDASKQFSKSVNQLSPRFLVDMDYVITLCAEEVCPVLVSKAKRLHWPLPDPAGRNELSREEQFALFRTTRDSIQEKLIAFKREIEE